MNTKTVSTPHLCRDPEEAGDKLRLAHRVPAIQPFEAVLQKLRLTYNPSCLIILRSFPKLNREAQFIPVQVAAL